MDLEKVIENIGNLCTWNSQQTELQKHIIVCLDELRDRRTSDLKPATKFLANSLDKQISHIRQEFNEVIDAKYIYTVCRDPEQIDQAKNDLAMELVDLQTSAETMLTILGYDESGRREIRRQVIAKNSAEGRRYYDQA